MAKPVRLALGYDAYTVEGDSGKTLTFTFETPPQAREAFDKHLAKAKKQKRLAATDTTPPGPQADRENGKLVRVWVTALETHDKVKNRLASEQLALLDLSATCEISVGLQQWHDSHKASFDPILDVIEAKRPPLEMLALGDYDNRGVHILRLNEPARVAKLGIRRLRLAATVRVPDWAWVKDLEQLILVGNVDAKLANELAKQVKLEVKTPRYEGIRE